MKSIFHSLLIILLLAGFFVLEGCETVPPTPSPFPAPVTKPGNLDTAVKAENGGDYVVASREYERLAKDAAAPQKQHFQMKAIEMLLKAGQVGEARQRVMQIDVSHLDPSFLGRKQVLQAKIASAETRYEPAIAFLNRAERAPHLDPALLADIYRTRAQAELALGRPINAARNLIGREKYLAGKGEIAENEQQLWHTLESMNRADLAKERTATADPILGGWLDLAMIALDNPTGSSGLANAVDAWRRSHPTHPASEDLLRALGGSAPGLIGHIDQIALLLPLTSEYGQAAQAVRDGFMAMDTANKDPAKPKIKVYDIGADPTKAPDLYAQAAQEGAQLIVGPLGLEATEQVAKKADWRVPTLLLTHVEGDINAPAGQVFQFGLPPEQEARQAAERAYLDGRRRMAVLYPNTPFGQRMYTAFSAYWERLGGVLVAAQSYALTDSDYADPVKNVLNIVQSEARKDQLESRLHTKLKFEARPRADIDGIFLAADARHGRLIKPQLNYYRAGDIPVYSTSYIFTGKGDPILDTDLDGIMFGDMPWMLAEGGKIDAMRQSLQGKWPYAHTGLDRLYALGLDAYAVIPQLNRIKAESGGHFSGVTSDLSIEKDGRLHRQLLWARFRQGVPQLLDTFLPYKGQFQVQGRDGTTDGSPQRP